MFFDAVVDARQNVLCNDTPAGVRQWLIDNYKMVEERADLMVCSGATLLFYSVDEYLCP